MLDIYSIRQPAGRTRLGSVPLKGFHGIFHPHTKVILLSLNYILRTSLVFIFHLIFLSQSIMITCYNQVMKTLVEDDTSSSPPSQARNIGLQHLIFQL